MRSDSPAQLGEHAIAKRKTAEQLRGHPDGAVSFSVLFLPTLSTCCLVYTALLR